MMFNEFIVVPHDILLDEPFTFISFFKIKCRFHYNLCYTNFGGSARTLSIPWSIYFFSVVTSCGQSLVEIQHQHHHQYHGIFINVFFNDKFRIDSIQFNKFSMVLKIFEYLFKTLAIIWTIFFILNCWLHSTKGESTETAKTKLKTSKKTKTKTQTVNINQ